MYSRVMAENCTPGVKSIILLKFALLALRSAGEGYMFCLCFTLIFNDFCRINYLNSHLPADLRCLCAENLELATRRCCFG